MQVFFRDFKIQNAAENESRDQSHWRAEARNIVRQIEDLLQESPSIRPDIHEYIDAATVQGRRLFETAYLAISINPRQPPQTMSDLEKI